MIHFIQRGWHNCNSVVVQGTDEVVLIDTGSENDVVELLALLRARDISPDSITHIINTHSHWDHLGGNVGMRDVSGAAIWMAEKTADFIKTNNRRALWLDYFNVEISLINADRLIEVGQPLVLASIPFETIPIPGHAPDMFALYQPDLRLLISSDALLRGGDCGIINVAVHGEAALVDARETTARLQTIEAEVAWPGHGPVVTDVTADLEKLAQRLAEFAKQPEKLVRHLNRRILMANLLGLQPIRRAEIIAHVGQTKWVDDYTPAGKTADFIHAAIDQFLARGVIREESGLLYSNVPK